MKNAIFFFVFISSYAIFAKDLIVEDQIRLCESDSSIISKLKLKPIFGFGIDQKNYKVYYIETDNRDFQKNKVSLRFRVKEKKVEITVKRRLNAPGEIVESSDMECEYDLHGGVKEYSCKINSDIELSDFKQIINNQKPWSDYLTSSEAQLIESLKNNFNQAKIFGYLVDDRYQRVDSDLGKITLDLVHPSKNQSVSYHEISIRYDLSDMIQINKLFNQYISSKKLIKCKDQLDWSVDKFSVMDKEN
jgi:uncharacterized protein YjbK